MVTNLLCCTWNTWKAELRLTNVVLDYIRDKHLLLLKNHLRGGISTVLGDRFVKSN